MVEDRVITNRDKLLCAERELQFRFRVYDRLVVRGKMSKQEQEREIELMSAIVEDYRALVQFEEPELELFIETARRDGFRVAMIDPLTEKLKERDS
jgi:hypothetical protein